MHQLVNSVTAQTHRSFSAGLFLQDWQVDADHVTHNFSAYVCAHSVIYRLGKGSKGMQRNAIWMTVHGESTRVINCQIPQW